MSDLQRRIDEFLAEFFRLNPTWATGIGDHAHDDRWPDLTAAGRRSGCLRRTAGWPSSGRCRPDGDEAIDRDLLVGELEAARFAETELREETWNPLEWVYLIGDGLFTLQAREFAPLADRLASTAGRLEGIPAVLDAARETLVGHAGRPVGRFQTETALNQLAGIDELIGDALTAADGRPTDAAVAAITLLVWRRGRDRPDRHRRPLRAPPARDRPPASEGEGRLGRELFTAKMRHTMRSATLTPERILAGAEREFVAVRAELIRLARDLWPTWRPDDPAPDDDNALVRGVLDAVAAQHPRAEDLLDFCRAENARIEAFCAERDLVGLADEPLEIRWTPVFLRSFGGAMLSSPGPLDKGQKAFFAITPMPDDWTEEQRESNLREDNDRMLRLLTIHEAVPGHYLQGVYANRCPSLVRSIFGSGLFAEGWAVYVTQVMMDVGYDADDPALLLTHWKFYLRSVTNAMIDAKIHCEGMTEERRSRSWSTAASRRRPRRAPSSTGRGCRRPSCRPTSPGRSRCGRSNARSGGGRRSRPATRAAPRRSRNRASSAGSGRRRASPTGRTSSRCWPTARRRPQSFGGSCSGSRRGAPRFVCGLAAALVGAAGAARAAGAAGAAGTGASRRGGEALRRSRSGPSR